MIKIRPWSQQQKLTNTNNFNFILKIPDGLIFSLTIPKRLSKSSRKFLIVKYFALKIYHNQINYPKDPHIKFFPKIPILSWKWPIIMANRKYGRLKKLIALQEQTAFRSFQLVFTSKVGVLTSINMKGHGIKRCKSAVWSRVTSLSGGSLEFSCKNDQNQWEEENKRYMTSRISFKTTLLRTTYRFYWP